MLQEVTAYSRVNAEYLTSQGVFCMRNAVYVVAVPHGAAFHSGR